MGHGGRHVATYPSDHVNRWGVSVGTGKPKHGNETLEELVGQLLMKWRRANLDSGAAGCFVLSLVTDYGDKQFTINRLGSRFGGVSCTD